MRRIVGAALRQARNAPGLDSDEGMNIRVDRVDLTGKALTGSMRFSHGPPA